MEFDGHTLPGLVNYKPLFGILRQGIILTSSSEYNTFARLCTNLRHRESEHFISRHASRIASLKPESRRVTDRPT